MIWRNRTGNWYHIYNLFIERVSHSDWDLKLFAWLYETECSLWMRMSPLSELEFVCVSTHWNFISKKKQFATNYNFFLRADLVRQRLIMRLISDNKSVSKRLWDDHLPSGLNFYWIVHVCWQINMCNCTIWLTNFFEFLKTFNRLKSIDTISLISRYDASLHLPRTPLHIVQ